MKKKYPTYIDASSLLYDKIAVSAGERGHMMILSPEDLIIVVSAKTADVCK